jgi:hypothetical protein
VAIPQFYGRAMRVKNGEIASAWPRNDGQKRRAALMTKRWTFSLLGRVPASCSKTDEIAALPVVARNDG